MKTLLIALNVDVPETAQGQDATVTIGEAQYTGQVTAIIITANSIPQKTVTLTGPFNATVT